MGIGGISIWQLLIILVIVMMLFGTKRLRNLGSDLGAAIKGFRSSVSSEEESTEAKEEASGTTGIEESAPTETTQVKEEETKTHQG
jgi:sec-independent protein translocase protein TatA